MILAVASSSFYLSVSKSRSQVSGYYFLSNISNPKILLGNQTIFHNAPIYVEVSILKKIIFVASESKITTAFANTKLAIPECTYLL